MNKLRNDNNIFLVEKQSHLANNLIFEDDVWDLKLVYLTDDTDIFNELIFITTERKQCNSASQTSRIPKDILLQQERLKSNHPSSYLFPVVLRHIEEDITSKDRDWNKVKDTVIFGSSVVNLQSLFSRREIVKLWKIFPMKE